MLEHLAARAAAVPGAIGSPTLLLNKSHPAFLARISLPSASAPSSQGIAAEPLELLFVKPRVLMNVSGPSIASALRNFLPSPSGSPKAYRILTLQDDLDLASLSTKPQKGGSPRGHNGIRSLDAALGSREFHRMRIGVGRPEARGDVARWVMGPLSRDEVRSCEFDGIRGGKTLEACWDEVIRIGWS